MLWIINFNCWQIVLRVELRCRGVVPVMELDIYSNPRGNPFLWPLQKAASCPYPAYFFSAWRKVIKGTGSPTYLISFRLKTVMNITQPVNIYLHILFRKHKQVWYIYIYDACYMHMHKKAIVATAITCRTKRWTTIKIVSRQIYKHIINGGWKPSRF